MSSLLTLLTWPEPALGRTGAPSASVESSVPGSIPTWLADGSGSQDHGTTLDLVFGWRQRWDGRSELLGGAVLALPFDRGLGAASPAPPRPVEAPRGTSEPRADRNRRRPAPERGVGSSADAARAQPEIGRHSAATATDPPRADGPGLEPCEQTPPTASADGSSGPSREDWQPPRVTSADLRRAIAAAQRFALVDREEDALADLANRARWSAVMPELRLRATRVVDESETLSPTEYDPERVTARGGTSLWLEARGSWKLDRAVFAEEEVRIAKLVQQLGQARERLRARVVALVFDWQRAAFVLARDAHDPLVCWQARLELEQLGVEIDLLTGGWFREWSRHDARRRPRGDCALPSPPTPSAREREPEP